MRTKMDSYRWQTWANVVWNIGFCMYQDDEGRTVFAFHGAWRELLRRVFDRLGTVLYRSYSVSLQAMPYLSNRLCPYHLCVTIDGADFSHVPAYEWPMLVSHALRSTVRCRVTTFQRLDNFLNDCKPAKRRRKSDKGK